MRHRSGPTPTDRFEEEPARFFERVREAYLDLARAEPKRIRIVNASGTVAEVQQQVAAVLGSLACMTPAWLTPAVASLTAARAAGRLPHALMIHDTPGGGGDWLAEWAASVALCVAPAAMQPCGKCIGCTRVAERINIPDLVRVHPTEESKQLRIEQVRELAQELSLTSHQGGYKVGILSPADSMNRFAANALLKTLEEPPARTLLILVAVQPSRLPATIMSRCQKIKVRAPSREESIAWLQATKGAGDWAGVLDVIGDAPFLAAGHGPERNTGAGRRNPPHARGNGGRGGRSGSDGGAVASVGNGAAPQVL